jgi:hypothetical protein
MILLACTSATSAGGVRPADWASLDGRRLVPIAASGTASMGILSSGVVVSFTQVPLGSGRNVVGFWDGCNGYVSPGHVEDESPIIDPTGVLRIQGFLNGAVGCPGLSAVEDWLAGFLTAGPRISIDGTDVIFDSNAATLTMTDAP